MFYMYVFKLGGEPLYDKLLYVYMFMSKNSYTNITKVLHKYQD